jgi:hypothetical protein
MLLSAGAAWLAAPLPLRAADAPLKLRDLYARDGDFSDLAQSLAGQRIRVSGFMAPPLKADAAFFVLTKMPMAVCPFCETEAEWPKDILAVYTKRRLKVISFNVGIEVRGVLDLGPLKDADTGFLSMVRLTDARYG